MSVYKLCTERKVRNCTRASVRKLFTSPSLRLPGEEQGNIRVGGLSDDNKAVQPKHATSSNASLFPLFWENKHKNETFSGMLLPCQKDPPTGPAQVKGYSPLNPLPRPYIKTWKLAKMSRKKV